MIGFRQTRFVDFDANVDFDFDANVDFDFDANVDFDFDANVDFDFDFDGRRSTVDGRRSTVDVDGLLPSRPRTPRAVHRLLFRIRTSRS